jgi:hypothetical protein
MHVPTLPGPVPTFLLAFSEFVAVDLSLRHRPKRKAPIQPLLEFSILNPHM